MLGWLAIASSTFRDFDFSPYSDFRTILNVPKFKVALNSKDRLF